MTGVTVNFFKNIIKFNNMYKMPSLKKATRDEKRERMVQFLDIIREELEEGEEILDAYDNGDSEDHIDTIKADLLCDIIIYCASEMERLGLPTEEVLNIIMESNFSKMGPDGKPIYDERGKLLKGPGYWRPEAAIRILLESKKK
jgi:predicted HAD superfamily Cof-like phosphohydrolase